MKDFRLILNSNEKNTEKSVSRKRYDMIGLFKNILGQVCGKWIGEVEWRWAHWLEICTESHP